MTSSSPSRLPRLGARPRLLVGILATVAVVVAVAWAVDVVKVRSAVAALVAAPMLMLGFAGAYTAAFWARAVAWSVLLPGMRVHRAFAVMMVALVANHALPIKAGEVLRPMLAACQGIPIERAAVATVAARAIDFLSVLTLAVALMATAPMLPVSGGVTFAAVSAAFVLVAATGLLWLRTSTASLPLPPALAAIERKVRSSVGEMRWRQLSLATALTLPSWVLEAVAVYAVAHAAGVELAPHAAVAVTAFTILFQAFHFTPGGVGVYEASMSVALVAFGVPLQEAVALALLTHGVKFAYAYSVGLAFAVVEVKQSMNVPVAKRIRCVALPTLTVLGLAAALVWWVGGWPNAWLAVPLALGVPLAVLARQWMAAWRPLPPASLGQGPVAVVIPAFNERSALPATLAAVPRGSVDDLRVVVVDDGSTDGTGAIAEQCGADIVVRHGRNRGLGAALRSGLAEARAMGCRAAVYLDADGEYDPAAIPTLLAEIDGGADYVLGSRYLGSRSGQLVSRNVANRAFTAALSFTAGRRISDGQTGFRAFSGRAVEAAEIAHDYNYAQVLTLDLLRKRMRLTEVPIAWRRRAYGKSFVRLEYLWRVPLGMARQLLKL